jgi:hypothetical protein
MRDIRKFILEKQAINFGSAKSNYGQCIILAGGPGSGKGFIKDNRVLATFKSVDVDDLKQQYIKMQKAGKIDDKYDYDLSRSEDTFKLHSKVKERGWKNKQRGNFWDQRNTDNSNLPNILWDMVSDDPQDVLDIIKYAKPVGYNITLVWVCCNVETAKQGNQHRDRRVPEDVLEKGHKGAYKCITDILQNKYKLITDGLDAAWIAFSAGYKRMLTKEYENDAVLKIKKDSEGNFDYSKKDFVDNFLKKQMPLDPDWDEKQEKERIRKSKLIKSLKESLSQL